MLKICPKLPSQIFEEPPLEEEILSFIRDLGHTVSKWKNYCYGKSSLVTCSNSLGMYDNKTVHYVYSLWEDLVYQVKNNNSKKNNDIGSGADEGTGSIPGVPDVSTYESDDEQISWKSSEDDDDDEVNVSEDNNDDADNDDDVDKDDEDDDADNQDDESPDDENQDDDDDDEQTDSDEVNEEESDEESDDESNEDNDEEIQGANLEEDEMDEEATHEEDEANELYRDVNINLEGRDIVMTDAPLPNVQGTQVTEDTHVIITAPIDPEDVPVTTTAEPALLSATTLPPTPLITHKQQTPIPTPATVLSSSLQDLPNFGSLFGFDHRLKTLETDFSEFKQTNQFAKAVSSIPDIVDAYLANKMHEAVKTVV
ncbi:hypothetical protein Tco_0976842 [Tanacetum coccineum]|uniref:Uncharacterized protein n=1 Tax=Tanacetum coccineum TaxID=301880 RepID=A0ABQ5EIF0_9ASTR